MPVPPHHDGSLGSPTASATSAPKSIAVAPSRGETFDVAVIGGGILGLATSMALLHRRPRSLLLLEAEGQLAAHQSGHNSGVIHSGVYYKPGSLKALLCAEGREALYRFCADRGIPYERCGKFILATRPADIPTLDELERRGGANDLRAMRRCSPQELREHEPHASCLSALHVPETGIVDFTRVTTEMAKVVHELGGEVCTESPVQAIRAASGEFILEIPGRQVRCRNLINCAGLQSDRVARMCGVDPGVQIIPFRGEYYRLRAHRRHLVRSLLYPVPDPNLPFLGVHLSRTIMGTVEAGPNAVLALARHGYTWRTVSGRDCGEMLAYPGFWRMARRHCAAGVLEICRSLSSRAFVRALQALVPSIHREDVEWSGAGVRAQAVGRDGRLIDDFRLVEAEGMIHVLNAPSPAATAAIAIGRMLAERVDLAFRGPARLVTGWLRTP